MPMSPPDSSLRARKRVATPGIPAQIALRTSFLLLLLATTWLTGAAFAQQEYPARPVRLIVPYPPGGPSDLIGRLTSELLTKQLGQNVVVDNRGGASTLIGAELAARA